MSSIYKMSFVLPGILPKDLEELFQAMSLVSDVKAGQKINFTTKSYQNPGVIGWAKRKFYLGEDCDYTCKEVKNITDKVIIAIAEKCASPYYPLLLSKARKFSRSIRTLLDTTYKDETPVNRERLRECTESIDANIEKIVEIQNIPEKENE